MKRSKGDCSMSCVLTLMFCFNRVWQHVVCMGLDRNNIPDEYLCEICKPRPVDRKRAQRLQSRRRNELLMNRSSSSDDEQRPPKSAVSLGTSASQTGSQVPKAKAKRLPKNLGGSGSAKENKQKNSTKSGLGVKKAVMKVVSGSLINRGAKKAQALDKGTAATTTAAVGGKKADLKTKAPNR